MSLSQGKEYLISFLFLRSSLSMYVCLNTTTQKIFYNVLFLFVYLGVLMYPHILSTYLTLLTESTFVESTLVESTTVPSVESLTEAEVLSVEVLS